MPNRELCLALLLMVAASATADVYRWVDADGNVVFSDKPHQGAEVIQLKPTTIVPGQPVEQDAQESAPAAPTEEVPYESVTVTAPVDEATLRDQHNVAVEVTTVPALQTEYGHKVQLFVDGSPFGGATDTPHFVLPTVDRGTHQLAAAVLDASGNEVARSPTSVFHLHKTSVNDHPANPPKAPQTPRPSIVN